MSTPAFAPYNMSDEPLSPTEDLFGGELDMSFFINNADPTALVGDDMALPKPPKANPRNNTEEAPELQTGKGFQGDDFNFDFGNLDTTPPNHPHPVLSALSTPHEEAGGDWPNSGGPTAANGINNDTNYIDPSMLTTMVPAAALAPVPNHSQNMGYNSSLANPPIQYNGDPSNPLNFQAQSYNNPKTDNTMYMAPSFVAPQDIPLPSTEVEVGYMGGNYPAIDQWDPSGQWGSGHPNALPPNQLSYNQLPYNQLPYNQLPSNQRVLNQQVPSQQVPNQEVPPSQGPSDPLLNYRPPQRIDPSYVPEGNPIPHKRGGKNGPADDFYPSWEFNDWGFTKKEGSDPTFCYHKSGEWNNQLNFSVEELEYYFNQTRGSLTMWVQHQPAQYTHRFAQGSNSMKCRFKECIAKNHTILKGFWRVAFDERACFDEPAESGTLYDPLLNAGYVHLWCLEKHFDLFDLSKRFIVKADNRNLRFEERNPMKIARDYIELADVFVNWRCARENEYHKQLMTGDPHTTKRVPKRLKLWFRLTDALINQEGNARKRTREERRGISLEKHMGDLRKYDILVKSRLAKQKSIRQKEKAKDAARAALLETNQDPTARYLSYDSSHSNSSVREYQAPVSPTVKHSRDEDEPESAPQHPNKRIRTAQSGNTQLTAPAQNPIYANLIDPELPQAELSQASAKERIRESGEVFLAENANLADQAYADGLSKRNGIKYNVRGGNADPVSSQSKELKARPQPHRFQANQDDLEQYRLDYKRRYRLRQSSAPPAPSIQEGDLRI